MRAEVCPPPGARLPADALAWTVLALFVAASLAIAQAVRRTPRAGAATPPGRWAKAAQIAGLLLATAATIAASVFVLRMHGAAGLAPVRDAWSATVATLVAWQVFHAAVLVLMAGYADRPDRRRPRRAAQPGDDRQRRPLLAGDDAAGALGIALVQLLPRRSAEAGSGDTARRSHSPQAGTMPPACDAFAGRGRSARRRSRPAAAARRRTAG